MYRAPEGHVSVSIHFSSDPDKNTMEWAQARRRAMPDEPAYLQEYEISWTSGGGNPVFSEFSNNPRRYVTADVKLRPELPVIRGWDFGPRNPACVWMQVHDGQVVVLREFCPIDIDIHSLSQVVRFLSGSEQELTLPRANQWVEMLKMRQAWYPEGDPDRRPYPIPWWPEIGVRFEDYSGPEAYRTTEFESTKGERSSADVLANDGIEISWNATPVTYGENIIRRLLLDMEDDRPGLLIHPSCTTLIEAMAGALTWKKPTKTEPRPTTIARTPGYIDVYDAFRYGVINIADIVQRVEGYTRALPTRSEEALLDPPDAFEGLEFSELRYDWEDFF